MRTGRVTRIHADGARTYEERFWLKVDKRGGDECWLWKGSINGKGYGVCRNGDRGEVVYAHRYSYYLENGMLLPDESNLMHSCDNPACVNPAHLREGSHLENMQDSVSKGRNAFGSRDGNAVLNERLVEDIINEWNNSEIRMKQLADKRGLHLMTLSNVVRGISWVHVTSRIGIKRKPFYGRPRNDSKNIQI